MKLAIGHINPKNKYRNPYFKKSEQANNAKQNNFISELHYNQMYLMLAPLNKSIFGELKLRAYEDYDSAEKLFRKNLKQGKPIFGNLDNLSLLSNDKVRRNLIEFLPKYAQEQLDKIDKNDPNNTEQIKSLTEIRDFFNEFREVWPVEKENNEQVNELYTYIPRTIVQPARKIAFAGGMTREDEKHCKNVVHGFSTACALVSAALGEGAAVGADTPILRCLQFMMFGIMADYLKVPALPSLEYYTKEMFAGATLGVGGAKLVTSWLGIGAHTASAATGASVATGGASDAVITGGVRAVNSSLSLLITEKMGRGYVRRVKNNQMTFKNQTIETASYFIGRGLLTGNNPFEQLVHVDFKDAACPELIKEALENIPMETQETLSVFLGIAKDLTTRAGTMFGIGMATDLILMKDKNPEKIKQHAKEIFKQSFINAVVYEICDLTVESTITKEATETVKDIQENLEKYPDVYKVFVDAEHEFFERINIDTLKYDAFTNQFKNRTFVHNFANWSNNVVREFSDAWRNRKRKTQAQEMKKAQDAIKSEQKKNDEIKSKLSKEDEMEILASIEEYSKILEQQKQYFEKKDNFGYGKIAGYEKVKEILAQKFILPVSTQGTNLDLEVPSAILFYGPTGVGKTELTKALAEQAKCALPKFEPSDNEEELLRDLEEARQKAISKNRRTVLRIDEFDEFGSNPKLAKIFSDFIEKCSADKITLFLTTNEPQKIDKNILNKTINIPISPPDRNDATNVFKFYLDGKVEENFDYDKLADTLISKAGNRAYSNSQIKRMCMIAIANSLKNKSNIDLDTMLELIKRTIPEISEQDLEKFNSQIKEIK